GRAGHREPVRPDRRDRRGPAMRRAGAGVAGHGGAHAAYGEVRQEVRGRRRGSRRRRARVRRGGRRRAVPRRGPFLPVTRTWLFVVVVTTPTFFGGRCHNDHIPHP